MYITATVASSVTSPPSPFQDGDPSTAKPHRPLEFSPLKMLNPTISACSPFRNQYLNSTATRPFAPAEYTGSGDILLGNEQHL